MIVGVYGVPPVLKVITVASRLAYIHEIDWKSELREGQIHKIAIKIFVTKKLSAMARFRD